MIESILKMQKRILGHFYSITFLSIEAFERYLLERFSFECRTVIGFALSKLRDWLKKLTPIFYPIKSKNKTN